ncbi:hypothetical protein RF55_18190 [Lasius niger]|uniref:Uncharacterized protein n=1 Tax=Lasius niger TaxID=67767 RepID=A0A0J7K196_LASNI|nr:hypothetical protein RF55_18190 [Lasius niger]
MLLEQSKIKTKQYYDKTAKKETKFQVGEPVLFQKIPKATWTPETVQAIGYTPRSYVIQGENGEVYNRNSIHVTPRERSPDISQTGVSAQGTREASDHTAVNTPAGDRKETMLGENRCDNLLYVTRAGRTVKKPKKFDN